MVELRVIEHRLHTVVAQGHTSVTAVQSLELISDIGLNALVDQFCSVNDKRIAFTERRSRKRQHVNELSHRHAFATVDQRGKIIDHATSVLRSVNRILRHDVEQVAICIKHVLEHSRKHRVRVQQLIVTVRLTSQRLVALIQIRDEQLELRDLVMRDPHKTQAIDIVLRVSNPHVLIDIELSERIFERSSDNRAICISWFIRLLSHEHELLQVR